MLHRAAHWEARALQSCVSMSSHPKGRGRYLVAFREFIERAGSIPTPHPKGAASTGAPHRSILLTGCVAACTGKRGSTACRERGEFPQNDRSVAINKCNMEYYRDPSVTEGSVSLVEFGNREKTNNKYPFSSSNVDFKAGGCQSPLTPSQRC